MSIGQLVSLLSKLGGLAVAAFGVNVHSVEDMTVGGALAAVVHGIDSIWNSPKGSGPTI